MSESLEAVKRLTRDLALSANALGVKEARFLVDAYYSRQEDRIRSEHQARTLAKDGEPHAIVAWLMMQDKTLEHQVKRALDVYSDSKPLGRWSRSICGIGPVIAAGLLANIDLNIATTASHIYRFAGLDPTVKWEKGQKRPWNAGLKRLCWLIGESFVYVSGNENDFYGKLYKQRKMYETEKNERLEYEDQAVLARKTKRFDKDTQAKKHYEAGRLPPARIHERAKRWTVKLFLSHYHEVGYNIMGKTPAKPFAFTVLKHEEAHYIPPPNW